ncbi:helix-turn-helix domain-containing protein [Nonomuraea soli]|uniref:Nitroimidazol reductase NimA-like FMN-containing flavoprotein (Pyridoxamine 5'-phosphate oxidase superfamily) n=1 Tax=Nonomuraea soli TaxID=1032476 RepID=A0A7W0CF24_9ACTN|nr:pyridoxamine 5'-phosphate oxidase family protein [Nonomuraea soli]MBA2889986.1 nitroimidazol reductase NimA-like FMN-containing flavoprotein (pyridoxamine 5'-phosphate oxidase superfamily) [Nonomuraea soli]
MSNRGDLARRIVHRRQELGLSVQDLAERAHMDPGYVDYIESNPATLTDGTLLRLAGALQTTADDLLGGDTERPPGRGTASHSPHLQELTREECLELISPGGVGRVAFNGFGGPVVFPVNYRVHDGDIIIRTRDEGVMDGDLRTGLSDVDIVIAFEVDRVDDAMRQGWSVLVQGPVHHLPHGEMPVDVRPWAGGERNLFVRIRPQHVTGRRIAATR